MKEMAAEIHKPLSASGEGRRETEVSCARILLADDEELFLRGTADLLRREGYSCDCVQDAGEAGVALETQSYDLLIVDIMMPGNYQLEFLQTLPDHLPVIVVTGYPSVPTAIESLRLCVVDYLVKPIELDELLRSVALALEKGQLWQMVHRLRGEVGMWTGHLDSLEKSMRFSGGRNHDQGLTWTLEHFLDQTMLRITQIAVNLKTVFDIVKQGHTTQPNDVCALLNCPKLAVYEDGLRDAIEVLEQTKSAFKSKELGALRRRLETLLQR